MFVFGPVLWAQAKSASPLPFNGFQISGAWDCEGTFRAGKPHKATLTGAVILNGTWIELTEKDVEPATGYLAKYLIGYDSQQKRLVEFDANNFGAAVYASDEGWQTDVLTMTSQISGNVQAPYAANRFVYTITGKDAFTIDWQISKTANLAWLSGDHLLCKHRISP